MNVMEESPAIQPKKPAIHPALPGLIAVVFALSFAALVVISDQAWLPWIKEVFSNASPNLWGLVSRGHMLLFGILVIVVWRNPSLFGYQIAKTFESWKLILILLVLNCGIVGGYLVLSGSTLYSGNE